MFVEDIITKGIISSEVAAITTKGKTSNPPSEIIEKKPIKRFDEEVYK